MESRWERLDAEIMRFLRLHRETLRLFFQSKGMFNGHPHLLFFIRNNEGITQRELATLMDIAPATVAVSVHRLEAAGLVSRVRDEKDGRVFHLSLTERGKDIDDRCRQGKAFLMDCLYQNFSEQDEEQLSILIEKMIHNLEKAYRSISEAPESAHPTEEREEPT